MCGKVEMDRRRFLKYAGGAAAATIVGVVGGKYVWDIVMKPPSPQDVVVIGGGLSGLTAAYLLTKEGKNVTVLEAGHTPGGRVGTYRWPNGQYNDIGGEEIFDCDEDAWWLLNELGLGGKARRFGDSGISFLKGQFIKPRFWEELLDLIPWENEKTKEDYTELISEITKLSGPSYRGEEPWLHDYLGSHYEELDEWSLEDWLLENWGNEELVWWIDVTMKAEFGTTSDEVSAGEGSDYLYYWWWEGLIHLEGGNDQIITGLVSKLPPNTVMMYCPVESVTNTRDGVEVQYGDGEVIKADAAIVAVQHTQALNIIEDLPSDKRTAMEKLIPTRVIIPFQQYSERFWRTADNSWTGDFLLTDGYPNWVVHGTALQDEETFGPKGVLNQFVNQPEALELWSEQRKEVNGLKSAHLEEAESDRITNALLDYMGQFWPRIREFLETPAVQECPYYEPEVGGSIKIPMVLEYEYYGPARPPRYVLDGHYLKNREPFERIFFACDWPFGFGMDAAVASAKHAVSQFLAI